MSRSKLCPIFEQCGLCSLLPHSQEEEQQKKIHRLQRLFSKPIQFVESPVLLGYRKRISLRCDKQGNLGYHQPKSHTLIPIKECVIADPIINQTIAQLPPCPVPIQSIEFRSNGTQVSAQIYSTKGKMPAAKKLRSWLSPFVNGIALDRRIIFGNPFLSFEISNVQHLFHPQSFFQVNSAINHLLIQEIIKRVKEINPTHILDLFAGAGNIGLALAQKGYNVTLMDSASTSCSDAQATCTRNDLKAKIVQSPIEEYVPGSLFFDLLILDPPRAGCGAKLKDFVITKPAHILYVSCHPNNLKRDASLLEKEGYLITDITAFNMFPGTTHIETLCSFRRDISK
jgi:23S rRNA (uracil1939-C5)-methyltransferase